MRSDVITIGTRFLSRKIQRAFRMRPVRPRPPSAATCCGGGRARADGGSSRRKGNGKILSMGENCSRIVQMCLENMGNGLFPDAVRRRSQICLFFGRRDSVPIVVPRDLRVRIVVDEFPDMRIFFGRRVVVADIPQIEVFQDLFDYWAGLENRNHPHLTTAIGTTKRIDLVDFLNQPRPSAAELFRCRFSGRYRRYRVVVFRLFSHASRLVRVKSQIANQLLVFVWYMNDEPGEPVEGVESLFGLSVL